MVKWLLPREAQFFTHLSKISQTVSAAAQHYGNLQNAQGPMEFATIAASLRQLEHDADSFAHLLYEELDKTFVTPIDREDLHELTHALDEIVDLMESSGNQIVLYKLPELSPAMRDLARIGKTAALHVAQAVPLLERMDKKNVAELQQLVIQVNSLENEGDRVFRSAMEQLFSHRVDYVDLVRQKMILEIMEAGVDASEDVMDVLRSVVVKNG